MSSVTDVPNLERSELTDHQLEELPKISEQAFCQFQQKKLWQRHAIIKRAVHLLSARQDELASDLTAQLGTPITCARSEISAAIKRAEHLVETSNHYLRVARTEEENDRVRYDRIMPLGPVLILSSSIDPYLDLVNSLIPALLVGNCVVLKSHPQIPMIVEHIHKLFSEAQLDENALQIFHCEDPEKIKKLVLARNIRLVCCTGSREDALSIQSIARDRGDCRTYLHLGGKAPAYVREDADLEAATEAIVDSALSNAGQSYYSTERVYVHESIHDGFVEAVQKAIQVYKVGDPKKRDVRIGPVVTEVARNRIHSQIDDAVKKGAKSTVLDDATSYRFPTNMDAVPPTILTRVNHNMSVMTDQTIGPVIPIMAVDSDERAIQLMNDSQFGLSASLWTQDVGFGRKLANELEVGLVQVNECGYPSPTVTRLVWKNIGRDQTVLQTGFEHFGQAKAITSRVIAQERQARV